MARKIEGQPVVPFTAAVRDAGFRVTMNESGDQLTLSGRALGTESVRQRKPGETTNQLLRAQQGAVYRETGPAEFRGIKIELDEPRSPDEFSRRPTVEWEPVKLGKVTVMAYLLLPTV